MQHSRSLSSTSFALALLVAACNGDEVCGPGDTAGETIAVSDGTATLTYGGLSSLPGNDCPDPMAPADVISLSIEAMQIDAGATTGRITLCIPRPDLLEQGNRTLGNALSTADIRIIDLKGDANGCAFRFASSVAPTGTGGGSGVCNNGQDPAGYAVELDAIVTLQRTCGELVDMVPMTLAGEVRVAHRDQ